MPLDTLLPILRTSCGPITPVTYYQPVLQDLQRTQEINRQYADIIALGVGVSRLNKSSFEVRVTLKNNSELLRVGLGSQQILSMTSKERFTLHQHLPLLQHGIPFKEVLQMKAEDRNKLLKHSALLDKAPYEAILKAHHHTLHRMHRRAAEKRHNKQLAL